MTCIIPPNIGGFMKNTSDPNYDYHKQQRALVQACVSGSDELKSYVIAKATSNTTTNYPDLEAVSDEEEEIQAVKAANLVAAEQRQKEQEQIRRFWSRGTPLGATAVTLEVLLSLMFADNPAVDLGTGPTSQYLIDSATASNQSLDDLAKQAAELTARDAECFCVVTFPKTAQSQSTSDVSSGKVSGKIALYSSDSVTRRDLGDDGQLNDVHCIETYRDYSDETRLSYEEKKRIRRFWIKKQEDGSSVYTVTLYTDNYGEVIEEDQIMVNGALVDYITGGFIGAIDNSGNYQKLPLKRIADLEESHYRADCECCQAMTNQNGVSINVFSEMDAIQFAQNNPTGYKTGHNAINQFGVDDRVEILKGNDNQLAFNYTQRQFEMLIAAGAQLFVQANANTAARTKELDQVGQMAVITRISKNVTAGMRKLIRHVMDYNGDSSEFSYEIPTKFADSAPTAADVQVMLTACLQGKLATEDLHRGMARNGMVSGEVDEVTQRYLEEFDQGDSQLGAGLADD